ncbi:mitochondrial import inner membrane translocase subunit TIM50 [Nematocida homosporus]|uniref:mitochondrial import inner membrane translocase subunit TIM50 n=1 Tax=Nematocida homosporus TaxID=1912981 RepID=UPI002220283A|nr:mitochondrial import inner membrane translocase subunit TIM50 [Nematocida homosporus]KAI5187198.1 mitochondrial import inner membrane translocase subunit TIM50 [Nematocida homosporus]
MGGVRRCLESLPILNRAVSAIYAVPLQVSKRGWLVSAGCLVAGTALMTSSGRRMVISLGKIGLGIPDERLPEQSVAKPTLFIDIEDVLLLKTWNWRELAYDYQIREYAEEFLFHLSGHYEVVGVSSLAPELAVNLLARVDPYGVIGYRMFVPNKDKLVLANTNRDLNRTIRIRGQGGWSDNDLVLGTWRGEKDRSLLVLTDFLVNLAELETEDFRKVIKTYKDRAFVRAYGEVQKDLYPTARKYLFFPGDRLGSAEIDRRRVEEYGVAKEYIDNQLKLEKLAKK